MTYAKRALFTFFIPSLMVLVLAGCSLFVSPERNLKRLTQGLQDKFERKDWKGAVAYMDPKMEYVLPQKKASSNKGQKLAVAFVNETDFDDFMIHVKGSETISDTKILIMTMVQFRKSDATRTTNTFCKVNFVWEKKGDNWVITQ